MSVNTLLSPQSTQLQTGLVTYEERLNQNREWAMNEGGLHFEGQSKVHQALRRIAKRLDELEIPYAVAGGMALFEHGYRRYTEDVDLIVTAESLAKIHEALDGLGYVRPFAASKHLRDTDTGVKIEFLITGGYPGDGLSKPVSFPDPLHSSIRIREISVLNLPKLVELKLASGMTGAGRRKDLGDVQEMIKAFQLPRTFGEQLNEYVRTMFHELWDEVEVGKKTQLDYGLPG